MGMFYCQGCNTYQDSKDCDNYIHTNNADYCSDECAPVSVVCADILKNLASIGRHPSIDEGVAI